MVGLGTLKTVKPMKVRCEASDCKGDHLTYDVRDICFMTEAKDLQEAQHEEHFDEMVADGRMVASEVRAYPTVLGYWHEFVSNN